MKTKTKSKSRRTLARQTAELIARELFSNGVNRLVCELSYGPKLPGMGWCEGHVADKIAEILNRKHVRKAVVKK